MMTGHNQSSQRLIGSTSVKAGLFLSRLIHLARQAPDPAGWLYQTQQELFEEKGLTEKAQVTAHKKIKAAGLLEKKLAGKPARLRYAHPPLCSPSRSHHLCRDHPDRFFQPLHFQVPPLTPSAPGDMPQAGRHQHQR